MLVAQKGLGSSPEQALSRELEVTETNLAGITSFPGIIRSMTFGQADIGISRNFPYHRAKLQIAISSPSPTMENDSAAENAITVIRTHRSCGTFLEGARFIQLLPEEVKSMMSVIIEIAQLYLVQGQWALAAETCDQVPVTRDKGVRSRSGRDEEFASFQLLKAYIGIGRYSKLKSALKVAQSVGVAWNLDTSERSCELVADGRVADTPEDEDSPFTEYRVLLSFYYWRILVVAAEQGLLDVKLTRAAAVCHISPIMQGLLSEGRLREARFFLYFKVGIMDQVDQALSELEEFLPRLNTAAWAVERALTLADIAEFQLKSDDPAAVAEADKSFDEARELFNQIGHMFGNINIDLARLEADRALSAGEKFLAKVRIADRYFEVHHFQNGIRCLAFAISPELVFDAYREEVVRALELLDRKINEVKSEILKQLSLLHSVSHASLLAHEYGFALRQLESYYAQPPEEIGPKNHSGLALMMGQVYSTFGETDKALEAAERALQVSKTGASYVDQSDAAFSVGIHMSKRAEESQNVAESMNVALEFMKIWADKDAENGYEAGESQKCLLIADWENRKAMLSGDPGVKTTAVEQRWIERAKKHISNTASAGAGIQLVDIELRAFMRQGRYSESLTLSKDWLERVVEDTKTSHLQRAQAFLNASIQVQLCVSETFQKGESLATETVQSAIKLLWSALGLAYKALQIYRQMDGVELVVDCTLHVWQILQWAAHTKTDSGRRELFAAFVGELKRTEKVCDDMRRSVLPVGGHGLRTLMNKRHLVAKNASLKLYNVGVNLALELDDPGSAWLWLQKGKARAFIDSLGAKSALPQRLLDEINEDEAACELLRREQNILDLLREPNVNFVIAARRLAQVRREMAENPLLVEASRLRDGLFNLELGTNELEEKLLQTGFATDIVKFVDWYVPSVATPSDQRIVLFVRQLDGATSSKELGIKVSEVRDWTIKAFDYPDMATPPLSRKTGNRLLKAMNPLTEGLASTTSEGDLLILSPSGPLSRVPLHALDVNSVPLMQRNIVVYASSAATLGQCLLRAGFSTPGMNTGTPSCSNTSMDDIKRSYFAVYEEPDKAVERDAIFAHINTLSQQYLPGNVALGPKVTKSHFFAQCASASWIHYHGHARYSTDDVLRSSLVLSNGTDLFGSSIIKASPSPNTDEAEGGHDGPKEPLRETEKDDDDDIYDVDDELSVSELFDLALPRAGGVHFTIIACDSGTQDLAPGDEPLGVIPALLYAGATSVLGCLWPIESRAGRVFSEALYAEVARSSEYSAQVKSPEGGTGEGGYFVDLARAVGDTVSKMRRGDLGAEFKQAYYWAPFAVHGLWYVPT